MNYYEQFYDDLEFCDPDDDLRRGQQFYSDDRYQQDDLYRHGDPYYHGNPYYHDDLRALEASSHYREYSQYETERNYMNRGRPDRRAPDNRGRGHGPSRGYGRSFRGRGRGQNQDQLRETLGNSRVNENERISNDHWRGRARGNMWRGNTRGGIKGVNFVKAGFNKSAATSDGSSKPEDNKKASESDQIRFDYRTYQNKPSESETEVEQAMEAYTCQLGYGYGYGPRNDLVEGDQPEWLISSESGNQQACQVTESMMQQESGPETEPKPGTDVKKAMVSPALNFVKAKTEFHSIDVAFHEMQDQKPKPNSLSVNFGNKRVGLGFGVSANNAAASGGNISAEYHAGAKDGCNPRVDAKFMSLQKAIKSRMLPNKNAIEVTHMAVDKVKMKISDEVGIGKRTPNGQAMFLCRLEIDGVLISQGQATTKKAAKHEAYQNGLKVFNHDTLTVKEISQGVFELRQKEPEFKVPFVAGMSGNLSAKGQGQKPQYTTSPNGGKSVSQSTSTCGHTSQSENSMSQSTPESRQANLSSYSKPKIVFHQPNHPLNNKPLAFRKSDSSWTGSQFQQSGSNTPEALATKLLNFVKENADTDKQTQSCTFDPSDSLNKNRDAYNINRNNAPMQNLRKRSAGGNVSEGRLKVQKKGNGNVNHSIDDLSQFILIDSTPLNNTVNELSVLHNSANFNRVVLKLEYENDGDGVQCSLLLSDIVVAMAHGPTKDEAKQLAVTDSLKNLKECCYTIKIKQAVDSDASGFTKEQLLSDIQQSGENVGGVIPDSNIGNMLLRKMGWVGGGCGKDGRGISEPVKAEMIIGREGLGLSAERGIGKNFHERVTKMLQDYIRSEEQKDLHFSSELQKEERAIIHKIGQKLGLKTNSKGKNENRYLIVSRKRSAQELLEHVRESGGSTSKYELIPPEDPDYDITRPEDIVHGHSKQ